jgi:aryl-alcohol dehydrogenase-like predicted oxidoreductase
MNYRILGKTGFKISELSLGTWQLGGRWGDPYSKVTADKILNTAIDSGINFIDTADVYNGGMSEISIGKLLKSRSEKIYVATKCGRRLHPHVSESYQPAVLKKFVEDSLKRLKMESLDLIQLHCPPTEVYYRPEIFGLFDKLKEEGKIHHLGVSVEKVEEALKAIEYENVTTIQIIFNMFRQRPADLFFHEAAKKNIGIIVRVPLASGLLTGTYSKSTAFGKDDHRTYNREGSAFDKGETFAGIDYETGLSAVEKIRELFPGIVNLAPIALKWVLMHDEVSCVIPGASRPEQVVLNDSALKFPDLSADQMMAIREIYSSKIKPLVHQLW